MGSRDWLLTVFKLLIHFGVMKMIWNCRVAMVAQFAKYTKHHWIVCLKGWILWCVDWSDSAAAAKKILVYSCFTMLYQFLLDIKVKHLSIYIYPLFWNFFPFRTQQSHSLTYIPGENHNYKRYMGTCVHYSTVYNSQDMEAP